MSDERPIFVISDLHIGDGGPRDNFGHEGSDRPEQLKQFLDHVESENGELIIIGDLFEFWQASLSNLIMKSVPLLDRFADLNTTYVLGNHDADLKHFIGSDMLGHRFFETMSAPITRNIGGKRFKFMHGHEVDPFNKGDAPGWGRLMAIFAGICEDKVGSPMLGNTPLETCLARFGEWFLKKAANAFAKGKESKTKSVKKELTPAQKPSREDEMIAKYAADKDEEGYDIAIVGHTHRARQIGDWYFNAGSWATNANNFVRIEPDGNAAVFKWQDGEAKPSKMVS